MRDQPVQLDRFVRSVHRRLIIVRAIERGGACAAVASLLAVVLAGAMWWRGRDALPLSAGMLIAGALIGLFWGFARRPRMVDAVLEADRQLDLADLLGSAWAMRASADPWAHTILALAEQRCATLSADAVIVRGFGGRAWGGIGLAASLVISVGLMSSITDETRAGDDGRSGVIHGEHQLSSRSQPGGVGQSASSNSPAMPSDGAGSEASLGQSPLPGDLAAGSPSSAARQGSPTLPGDRGQAGTTNFVAPRTSDISASGSSSQTGRVAAGGLASSADSPAEGRQSSAGRVAGGFAAELKPAPPWQSAAWPTDPMAALGAVSAGQVPDAYRDIVREYFRDPQETR